MRNGLLLGGLAVLALASLLFSLHTGSIHLGWPNLVTNLLHPQGETLAHTVIFELRLPRAIAGFATGGLLALAGALMQVLLRNPLADPYILGVSGGASAAALAALLIGAGAAWLPVFAFAGALFSMALVFGLARGQGSWTTTRLLLTGVVVAAGWGALISFLLAISPASNLQGMLFWLMGDLSLARNPWPALGVLAMGTVICLVLARSLNLLGRGDLQAAALGLNVASLRSGIYVLASLLTATAVSVAGSIGFVGLVVPHLLRLVVGSDHRLIIPGSILLGGTLLVFADTLARSLIAPTQLPVGVVTALVGVPVFLWLLYRGR